MRTDLMHESEIVAEITDHSLYYVILHVTAEGCGMMVMNKSESGNEVAIAFEDGEPILKSICRQLGLPYRAPDWERDEIGSINLKPFGETPDGAFVRVKPEPRTSNPEEP